MAFNSSELLSIFWNQVCDDQQAEIERLRAEVARLRGRQKFYVDVELAGPGGAPVHAAGTLSRRECRGIVNVVLEVAEGAGLTLGSLLEARLVLRNAWGGDHPDVVKEVAELARDGWMGVDDGELEIAFFGGNVGVHWGCSLSWISDDVPVPEEGDEAEWRDGPPEWLEADRDVPVQLHVVELYLPHLFEVCAGDDEGGNGTD